jgi:hypothetical protein
MQNSQDVATLMEFLSCPVGDSSGIIDRFAVLPGAQVYGRGEERFAFVPGERDVRLLLVAHADTVWAGMDTPPHVILENGQVRSASHRYGIGADDRAGCAILWLLREMGHSLLVTDGEEQGRRGSRYLMANHPRIAAAINDDHHFVVQFDRCNSHDFKCYDVGTERFRAYMAQQTGYTDAGRGSFTDICTLCRSVAGVNLSVGYREEHTPNEHLIVSDWLGTLNLCRTWLDQVDLPRFNLPDHRSVAAHDW